MINSVSSSSQVAQSYSSQQSQSQQTHKSGQDDKEPQDTVVLSKQASESNGAAKSDSDHDGH
jgi:hypothetical protein